MVVCIHRWQYILCFGCRGIHLSVGPLGGSDLRRKDCPGWACVGPTPATGARRDLVWDDHWSHVPVHWTVTIRVNAVVAGRDACFTKTRREFDNASSHLLSRRCDVVVYNPYVTCAGSATFTSHQEHPLGRWTDCRPLGCLSGVSGPGTVSLVNRQQRHVPGACLATLVLRRHDRRLPP